MNRGVQITALDDIDLPNIDDRTSLIDKQTIVVSAAVIKAPL